MFKCFIAAIFLRHLVLKYPNFFGFRNNKQYTAKCSSVSLLQLPKTVGIKIPKFLWVKHSLNKIEHKGSLLVADLNII